MQDEINIVASGGEMKGGFVAGVLFELFSDINLDLENKKVNFYAVSASVPTILYYMSYGKNAPNEIWTKILSKEEGKVNNGILKIDVDHLLNVLRQHPFILDKILNTNSGIIFPAYNVSKQRVDYFSNHANTFYKNQECIYLGNCDIYSAVKAAVAAPVVYGKTVQVGEYEYCDPGAVTHFLIPEDTNPSIYILQNKNFRVDEFVSTFSFLFWIFSKTKIPYFKFAYSIFHKHKLYKQVKQLVKQGRAILLEPVHNLKGGPDMALSEHELMHNYTIGIKTFQKMKDRLYGFVFNIN